MITCKIIANIANTMDNIKVKYFQIYFNPEGEYGHIPTPTIYNINQINYLAEIIQSGNLEKIKYVVFYFDIYLSHAAFVYHYKKNNYNYIFAPCYNYMTQECVLSHYKTSMINILLNTIVEYSADIKNIFINHIDESQEIIHVFEDD